MVVNSGTKMRTIMDTDLISDAGILPKRRIKRSKIPIRTIFPVPRELGIPPSTEEIKSTTASRSNTICDRTTKGSFKIAQCHLHEGAWGHMSAERNSFPSCGQIGPVGEKPGANKHMSVTEASPSR